MPETVELARSPKSRPKNFWGVGRKTREEPPPAAGTSVEAQGQDARDLRKHSAPVTLSAGVGTIFPAALWNVKGPELAFLARRYGQCRSPYVCEGTAGAGGYCPACAARFRAK